MNTFKVDAVVIGAGLFGSMTAKYLKSKGIETLIIDRNDPMAASKCSSGIWKPGWAGKIQREVELSLPIISKFTAIDNLPIFDADKNQQTTIDFIDCNNILNEEYFAGEVIGGSIATKSNSDEGVLKSIIVDVEGQTVEIEAKYFIICTGAFVNETLKNIGFAKSFDLDSYWGAVLHSDDNIKQNFISQWAPYKQMYGLSLMRGGENLTYFTTGTAVKNPPKGGDNRTLAGGERLVNYASANKIKSVLEIPEGFRPFFAQKDTPFVNKHAKNVWSATGGAKNSTLLCGFIAKTIFDSIK